MVIRVLAITTLMAVFSICAYCADTTIKGTTSDSTASSLEVTNSANTSLILVRNDGNVGVGTASPNTNLDISGTFAHRRGQIAVSAGNNNNVNVGSFTFVKITSAANNFTITGITGGVDGRRLIIWNSTTRNMSISNESASSTAANRITTNSGGTRSTGGPGTAEFVYDTGSSRWVLTNIDS